VGAAPALLLPLALIRDSPGARVHGDGATESPPTPPPAGLLAAARLLDAAGLRIPLTRALLRGAAAELPVAGALAAGDLHGVWCAPASAAEWVRTCLLASAGAGFLRVRLGGALRAAGAAGAAGDAGATRSAATALLR
jgi:hypothetical protein